MKYNDEWFHPHTFKTPTKKISGFQVCTHHVCYFLKKSTLYFFVSIITLSTMLFLSGSVYAFYYMNKVIPSTTIAGESVTGKTQEELNQYLNDQVYTYEQTPITLVYQGKTYEPTLLELGYNIDKQKTAHNALTNAHQGNITKRLKEMGQTGIMGNNYLIEFTLNRDTLTKYLTKIKMNIEKPAQNAELTIENGKVFIISEQNGTKVDTAQLELTITASVQNLQKIQMEIPTVTLTPYVTAEGIKPTQELATTIISRPLHLSHEEEVFEITSDIIETWIATRETRDNPKDEYKYLELYLNNDAVTAYIEDNIAPKIEQTATDTVVINGKEKSETLETGTDGLKVDTQKTLSLIQGALLEESERNIEIPIRATESIEQEAEIPNPPYETGKQIIVSTGRQLAFAFDGKELIYVTKVSTGVPGHDTPHGEYKVYGKSRSQKMSGPGYYLPNVEWILWYYGDYSLHGTYWHNNFGNAMSHGCTNLSNTDAEWFFNWAEVGTPVINID